MSHRLAVMYNGGIVQCGEPREVYEAPATAFVAEFLGVANLFDVEFDGSGICMVSGHAIRVDAGAARRRGPHRRASGAGAPPRRSDRRPGQRRRGCGAGAGLRRRAEPARGRAGRRCAAAGRPAQRWPQRAGAGGARHGVTPTGCHPGPDRLRRMARSTDRRLTFNGVAQLYDDIRPGYPAPDVRRAVRGNCRLGRTSSRSVPAPARPRVTCSIVEPMSTPSRSDRRWPPSCERTSRRTSSTSAWATSRCWTSRRGARTRCSRPPPTTGCRKARRSSDQPRSSSTVGPSPSSSSSRSTPPKTRASSPRSNRSTNGTGRATRVPRRRRGRTSIRPCDERSLPIDRFRDVQLRRYDWDQTYSAADFRTLMVSYSGTQMMDEAAPHGPAGRHRVVRARAVRGQRHPTARRGPDHGHPFLTIRDGAGLAPQSPVWRYSRIMPSIQVKDVPDDVHAILRSRAAAARMSLQEYLLARLIDEAHAPTLEEVFAPAGGRAGGQAPLRTAAKVVRSDRDSR